MRYFQTEPMKRKRSADALLPYVFAYGAETIELPSGQFAVRIPAPDAVAERVIRRQLPERILTEIEVDDSEFLEIK